MKIAKKLATVAICTLMMFNIAGMNVSAASTTQDGLEVSFSTDKETYTKEEKITTTLSVKNTNSTDVTGVTMETVIPDGYEVVDGLDSSKQIGKLASNETVELKAVYSAKSTNKISEATEISKISEVSQNTQKINTGDSVAFSVVITLMMIVALIIMTVCIKRKKGRKILSIILTVSIIGSTSTFVSVKTNAFEKDNAIYISTSVTAGEETLKLSAKVAYSIFIDETDQDNWESLLGLSNDIDLTDSDENNVPDALEVLLQVDTDGDTLPDVYEKIYKTDPNNLDTDNDRLPDGYELYVTQTDPLKSDTNNNGISDDSEDIDTDGLSNYEEYQLKTDPRNADTDKDTLNDSEEVNKYSTSPIKKDTDDDGLNDDDELKYNMKPNKVDSLGDGVKDGERIFSVSLNGDESDNKNITASIDVDLQGNQLESLSIEKVPDEDVFLNSTIPGYIGNAYELNVNDGFNTATLSFEINPDLLNNPNFEPCIYYWDSETQTLTELENQTIEDNVISVNLEHFSSYILVNKRQYTETVYEYEIDAPTTEELQNKTFDIYLTLDESGSISRSNFSRMKNCCIKLIDSLSENDEIGIITFDDSIRNVIGLSDIETAKQTINSLYQHDGATALYDAVDTSINALKASSDSSRIVIALTDGLDNSSGLNYSTVSENAKNNNVVLYTIGVGSNVDSSILTDMAVSTGGQYYSVSDFNSLSSIFERVIENADLYKDSDEDGISDYHEKCITNGKLKLGTGATVPNLSSLSYLNEDSDGDNMFDGEEIEIKEKIVNGKSVYYAYLFSNPCILDTDSDGLDDYVEWYSGLNPLVSGLLSNKNSNDLLNTNKFDEWLEMVNNHSWNYIHNLVEADITTRYMPNIENEVWLKSSTGKNVKRIDLLHNITRGIWDVKPASYQFSPKRELGIEQIKGYETLANQPQNNLNVHVGGGEITGSTISYIPDYQIVYTNNLNGLITYYFTKKLPVPVEVPVEESVEEPVTELNPERISWNEWLWEAAKSFGYSCKDFGGFILDSLKDMGDWVCYNAEEIVNAGVQIGGFIGILYIIVHLAPILCVAV